MVAVIAISLPKKEKTKPLIVEDVLKEADQALAFDPLRDAKDKPQAVKPLLQVLLAIREKHADIELKVEEADRILEEERARKRVERDIEIAQEEAFRRKLAAQDPLNGRIHEGHPHYQFTEAGRREAQQNQHAIGHSALELTVGNQDAVGHNALRALGQLSLTADAYQLYQRQQQMIQQQAIQKQAVQQAMRRLGT